MSLAPSSPSSWMGGGAAPRARRVPEGRGGAGIIFLLLFYRYLYFFLGLLPLSSRASACAHSYFSPSPCGGRAVTWEEGTRAAGKETGGCRGGAGWGRGAHPKYPPPPPSGPAQRPRGLRGGRGDSSCQERGANKLKSTNSSSETPRGEAAASLPSPRACGNVFCVP